MKFIWVSFEGIGFAVAKRLLDEGNEVIVGQVESYKDLGIDKEEDPKDTKMRLQTFDGIIEKKPWSQLKKELAKIENKDEWGVICDFNNLGAVADEIKEMGFAGENCTGFIFLPTQEQHALEGDRERGKKFVEDHYLGVELAEVHNFKTTDECIQFLMGDGKTESDKIWVLKANNDDINVVVPRTEDPKLARDVIIAVLSSQRAGYEMQGFILEEKISNPLEITPQITFYNGDPVIYDYDIENKPVGAGNMGPQTGCAQNLIVAGNPYDKIVDIAFPPIVYDMALQHKGLFIWDASILIDGRTGKLFFGEFCANRWGWDSFFTELSMCDSVTDYFKSVMQGENPLKQLFGASTRLFNVKKDGDKQLMHTSLDGIWLYDFYQNKNRLLSIGYSWDSCVLTGAGFSIDDAIDSAYDRLENIDMDANVVRPKFDFISMEYPTAIFNRYNYVVEHNLIMGEAIEGRSVDERVKILERKVEQEKQKHRHEMGAIRAQLLSALDDGEE